MHIADCGAEFQLQDNVFSHHGLGLRTMAGTLCSERRGLAQIITGGGV